MRTLIKSAKIVNEGNILNLDLLKEDDKIKKISKSIDVQADLKQKVNI